MMFVCLTRVKDTYLLGSDWRACAYISESVQINGGRHAPLLLFEGSAALGVIMAGD